jgi:hypothetical protein
MALSAIDDSTSTALHFFAIVQVYDRTLETTATLYWGEGECTTDKVDGTTRDWEARIDGCGHLDPDQKIGQSKYAHPSADINVWLGNNADSDKPDALWDYFADDQQWEGQSLKLYEVDMSQDAGAGAELVFHGKVGARPAGVREAAYFRLRGIGRHQGERLPNQTLTMATEWRCAFLQPLVWSTSDAQLGAGVNAVTTTWTTKLTGTVDMKAGMVVACCDAGTGANLELAWIEEIVGGHTITVKRGYMGTTPVGHAQNDWVYALLPGPLQSAITDAASGQVIPTIVGSGTEHRGCYEYTDLAAARGWRTLGGGHTVEVWISCGVGPQARKYWYYAPATDITADAAPTTYNDISDAYGANVIAHGDAIPVYAENVHLEPNPVPSGTYVEGEDISGHKHLDIKYWVRVKGLTRENTEAGTALTTVAEVIKYVMQTTTWGLGYTLADVVDSGTIDGWDSGDFPDEYTEAWYDETAGAFPAFGATEKPYALDVLQEFCDSINADIFVRGGLLFPKRRKVEATADLTVERYHLYGADAIRLDDPQGAYCNVLRAAYTGGLVSEPDEATEDEPVTIPFESIIGDDDEITHNAGDVVEKRIARKWARFELAEDWDQGYAAQQTRHLEHWEDAHKEQLDMRAQPQIYVEATLLENCSWIGQGHTVAYNITGITTRKGQVRQVERRRAPQGDAAERQPIVTKIRSYHISFPT